MKLEEFENLTDAQLRERAMKCFEDAPDVNMLVGTILLPKARFYLDEIERRKDDRIARRDFRMELIVIFLICAELLASVGLFVLGEHDQGIQAQKQLDAIGKVQTALVNLDDSSRATADTLKALKNTTETMNGAIQKEVGLFYDVEINVVYTDGDKQLTLINNGRTNTTLWGGKIGDRDMEKLKEPQIITPGGGYKFNMEDAQKSISQTLAKGASQDLPMVFLVENERKERFTIRDTLTALWRGDTLSFNTHNNEVVPGWDRK